jgi:hypothetical protein
MAYIQKNNPFKLMKKSKSKPKPKYVKVFGGGMKVDVSTKKGREELKRIKSIPTVSSTEPGRVTKAAKKILKGTGKIAGKALMGGIIDPTNKKDPRIVKQIQKANKKKIDSKKTY